MATHDYVIDNQSAPSFRADLNNALMAIVSQNSNSTAPTTTFANMIWYDTATNILKKRNEANSAWISLGTIDEAAGTFTPSGERALASQAQAEAGTDNTTLMTPLRAAQAIAALTPAPTAAEIGSGNADLSAGAIGTYGFFYCSTADVAFGSTVAGSTLTPSGMLVADSTNLSVSTSGSAQSGTWRCMGFNDYKFVAGADPDKFGVTLWMRIS